MWWGALHSDVVVAVSTSVRDHLARAARVPGRKLRTLVNGIDTDRFRPGARTGALRDRFGVPPDAPLVGTVARFSPVKNQTLLLDAFAAVRREEPRARLALVGDGPLREELAARAAALGIADAVHFAGLTPDPAAAYRDLDAFALSSLSEGTSISVLEAMASGVPVVATAVGGTPALLDGGACGALVPSGDAAALADRLLAALRDPAARAAAERARGRAVDVYSLHAMTAGYERLYRPPGA
jgi:glycosyltransferase involved in cell wall biosynthesis